MKRLKEFLELLVAFVKAWPVFISTFLLLLSLIISVSKLASISIRLSLPLPLIIAVAAFVFYPVGKFIQWLLRKPSKPFMYSGLLWKPSKLSFRYPTPICPRDGCGCGIIPKVDQAVDVKPISGPFLQPRVTYQYTFECPIHGVISGAPSEDIVLLQKKARMVQDHNNQ